MAMFEARAQAQLGLQTIPPKLHDVLRVALCSLRRHRQGLHLRTFAGLQQALQACKYKVRPN